MPTSLSRARAALARLDEQHEHYYATLLDPFEREITEQVVRATASLTSKLRQTLTFDAKQRVALTWANRQLLGTIDNEFESLLRDYGYERAIGSFVNEFPGQLPFLRDELDILNAAVEQPLLQGPLLAAPDLDVLHAQQQITRSNLIDVAATVGDLAKRKILLSVNGLPVDEMTRMLSKSLGRTIEEASSIAATSSAMFYRTAYGRVIDRIEQERPRALRYSYDGPRDNLNRPFCREHVDESRAGRTWSRNEIDAMDNAQGIPVWYGAGGFRCRHQWRISLENDG